MKTAVGLVIWAIIVLLTLFVSIKITIDLWSVNTVDIGPHEIGSVSSQSTVTIPESNITITGQNYFEIQALVSKEITLPEVIPPAIGETNTHFNIKNPPPGRYLLLKASADFYSETPTKITVRGGFEEAIIFSLLYLVVTIFAWGVAFFLVGSFFFD